MSAQSGPPPTRSTVVVVDDNENLLVRIRSVLRGAGYEVWAYASGAEFLRAVRPGPPCCFLLDVDMPGLSGLDIQKQLLNAPEAPSVVFMTGLRDVGHSIQAFRRGAVDFLLKPFANEVLLEAVARALRCSWEQHIRDEQVKDARARLATLTPREREVCLLVAEGLTSREIGSRLGVAEGTVALHRAHLMSKLAVESLAEVVRLVDLAGSATPA
ncbi:MAG TPA: response regulator [Anaeromyxobacter sp.]|nr:response regulator [Anaeromyxobacter sp.]